MHDYRGVSAGREKVIVHYSLIILHLVIAKQVQMHLCQQGYKKYRPRQVNKAVQYPISKKYNIGL
jgi:hypothetical protein